MAAWEAEEALQKQVGEQDLKPLKVFKAFVQLLARSEPDQQLAESLS